MVKVHKKIKKWQKKLAKIAFLTFIMAWDMVQ